jgi:pimeloyl-ACP methyl ester carboxylesterase
MFRVIHLWYIVLSVIELSTVLISIVQQDQTRPPINDLATDTEAVRKFVQNLIDGGREVTVLMHSYGGQVGTNALYDLGVESRARQNLSGGVSHLIYMCAFALPEGGSMIKKVEVIPR